MGRYLRRIVAIPFFGLHQCIAFILRCGWVSARRKYVWVNLLMDKTAINIQYNA